VGTETGSTETSDNNMAATMATPSMGMAETDTVGWKQDLVVSQPHPLLPEATVLMDVEMALLQDRKLVMMVIMLVGMAEMTPELSKVDLIEMGVVQASVHSSEETELETLESSEMTKIPWIRMDDLVLVN
jgi:hypothetical protein